MQTREKQPRGSRLASGNDRYRGSHNAFADENVATKRVEAKAITGLAGSEDVGSTFAREGSLSKVLTSRGSTREARGLS